MPHTAKPIRAPGTASAVATLTADERHRLCDVIYRRTGMVFGDARHFYVERRVIDRMQATGSADFPAYLTRLLADRGDEVEALVNSLTVNETYFFREDHQLRALSTVLLQRIAVRKRRGEAIRIWSLPCATGEEAYSIAIWLLEYWAEVDRHDIEIVGSDIDTRALHLAEAGRYGERALHRLPRDLVRRYFDRDGDLYRIIADLRGSVRFTAANLVDAAAMRGQGSFDVVFCRNVLIYFDDASRRLAAENLYDCLAPCGYLCLGHTESMSRISPLFHVLRTEDAILYQKPDGERCRD